MREHIRAEEHGPAGRVSVSAGTFDAGSVWINSDDVESLGSEVERQQPVPAADIEGVRSFGWYGAQDHTVVVDVQVPSDLLLLHATETTTRPFSRRRPNRSRAAQNGV